VRWRQCEEGVLPNDYVVTVALNLHFTLLWLRREKEVQFPWVDVVRIDQTDLEERAQQVFSIMGRISSLCHNTEIWLGQLSIEFQHTCGMHCFRHKREDSNLIMGHVLRPRFQRRIRCNPWRRSHLMPNQARRTEIKCNESVSSTMYRQ
jgi:hypothetical protein